MSGSSSAPYFARPLLSGFTVRLMESPDLVQRAREIDPGAWSLNGTDQRRKEAVWKAYREQTRDAPRGR